MKKSNQPYELIVVADIKELDDTEKFEKHLKKEGFEKIENEPFAYKANSSTSIFHTRAYIHEVFSKAIEKTQSKSCYLIIELANNPMEAFCYSYETKIFEEVKLTL